MENKHHFYYNQDITFTTATFVLLLSVKQLISKARCHTFVLIISSLKQ